MVLRAVWGWLSRLVVACVRWLRDPANRRILTVLPLVVLGHLLLVWLLIQNRWIVMSTTTVTVMPPIMASIVLSGGLPQPGSADDRVSPWGKQKGAKGDGQADLTPSFELSMGAPRVQRSVPWLNTELLPELRGNSADKDADQLERTQRAAQRPKTTEAKAESRSRSTASNRQQVAKSTAKTPSSKPSALQAEATKAQLSPGEGEVLRIPPPPAVNDFPLMPAPQAPVAQVLPVPPPLPIPSIPDPVNAAPRDIPPLWSPQAAPPPPKLVAIPPPPPVLKSIPAPAVAQQPAPVAPEPPAPERLSSPSPPKSAAAANPPRVAAVPAPPSLPTPPLELTPSPVLPTVSAAPPPVVGPATVVVPASTAPAVAVSPAATAAPAVADAVPVRNPMVVEVPRYRLADPSPSNRADAGGNPTGAPSATSNVTSNAGANGPEARGSRIGPEGAGSPAGSALGLGAANPAPLPVAAASAAAPPNKSLNLSLPRVEVYRSGIGPVRQPNFADQANAQLRRGAPKDPMAEAINSAETPDCLKDSGMGLLGAPVAAYKAMTGKCK
jgi:hypothetical protein